MKPSQRLFFVLPALLLIALIVIIPLALLLSPSQLVKGLSLALSEPGSIAPVVGVEEPITVADKPNCRLFIIRGADLGVIPNSLVVACLVSLASTLLGLLAATGILLYRPLRISLVLALVALLPYPFVEAYVVQRIFNPDYGLVNSILRPFGFCITFRGLAGVAVYQIAVFAPLALILIYTYSIGVAREAYEAAVQHGVSLLQHTLLTARLSRPAVAASISLIFVLSLDDVAGPYVFQQDPSARSLLAFRAYSYFMDTVTGTFSLSAIGYIAILTLLSLIAFIAAYPSIAVAYRAAPAGSMRYRAPLAMLDTRALPFIVGVVAAALLPAALKLLAVAYGFSDRWVAELLPSPGFGGLRLLAENPDIARGIANSIVYTVISLLLLAPVAVTAAYAVARGYGRSTALFDAVLMSPLAIPGIAVAYAVFFAYHDLLRGTILDPLITPQLYLVLGYAARRLPLLYKLFQTAIASIPLELEEVATNLGAGVARKLAAIVAPLALQASSYGAAYVAVSIASEVSLSITIGGLGGSSGTTHPAPLMYLVASYMGFEGLKYAPALSAAMSILYAASIVLALAVYRLFLLLLRNSYR
ncbi:ABC transporter permease [Hyperthermus butylicus]|uniref:ABC-type Fe3+ transport permease, ThiP n=1 Tax=Hyperthermus butylicus (strain DSM 5456 / JCM 9403 / PLM1-5) TaxID=415426 RepID=A2BJW1_HYPBU|nr:iron ABC transporter permease [Hyperthermus butylicus]ABM80272.1 ABC-type Fe3+ transport permease, ThiP [Hyperthermus butylicus DSM 5456]